MMDEARAGAELFAKLEISEGTVVARLFVKDAPKAVENFVGLATGEKTWRHPGTDEPMEGKPLYDGTKFHLCLSNFRIQGGDPLGNGRGGPGFEFEDEFQSGRKFDRPGLLAMANRGPNTNGSQFFITTVATPWLNGMYTIFGEVISGQNVVERIGNVIPKDPEGRPKIPVTLKKVTISKST